MEIVKELNLNKSPQSVKSNSLICAKNIKISADGQYITNEEGVESIFHLPNDSYNIVGIITCNTELVIFAYSNINSSSKIYRYNEKDSNYKEVFSSWKWSKGSISGTYTYNINNELIIAIAEYTDSNTPLKTINLDTCSSSDNDSDYNLNPNIVPAILSFKGFSANKDCKTGTYYFFIRYKISNNNYTKWFSIGIPTMSYSFKETNVINHTWRGPGATPAEAKKFFTMADDVGYNSKMNLEIKNSLYKSCELAYIIDSDNATFGRIWNEYPLIANEINSFDLEFNGISYREVGVDELLEIGINLYDVKTIANYNNRLYISNYKEEDVNIDISEYTKDIVVKYMTVPINIKYDIGKPVDYYTKLTEERGNIRSLVPGDVYNFYLHFVRPDGTYTNGCRINNNTPITRVLIGDTYYNSKTQTLRDVFKSTSYPDWINKFAGGSLVDLPLFYLFNTKIFDELYYYFGYYANEKGEVFFRVPDYNADIENVIVPTFENIKIPKGYIGAFISYEEVEPIIKCTGINGICPPQPLGDEFLPYLRLTAADTILDSRNFEGSIYRESVTLYRMTTSNALLFKANSENRIYDITKLNLRILPSDSLPGNIGREAAVSISVKGGYLQQSAIDKQYTEGTGTFTSKFIDTANVGQIIAINKNLYNNKYKKLITLGYILYKDVDKDFVGDIDYRVNNYRLNLPAYVTLDQNLVYRSDGAMISDDGNVTNAAGDNVEHYVNNIAFYKYSYSFLELLSINKEPETIVTIVEFNGTKRYVNKIVKAINSTDLFKLKPQNIIKDKKLYFKYDKESLFNNVFLKTIRRSDVIQTESLINKWKNFKADGYKYISENKGNITNVVGVGVYLLVHTEHSLFMFNRDASLKTQNKDVQLTIPDAFDTEYQEVFTSDKGYGGLQDSDAWIVNEFGYTFFDNSSKRLYNFDNGTLNILSLDITNLLNSIDIAKIVIGYDSNNNRFILSIKSTTDIYTTLSYNYLSKSWISLHDYCFKGAFNTKENIYLSPISNSKVLYSFGKSKDLQIGDYKELLILGDSIFPVYKSDSTDGRYSYMDIIFNEGFETPKVLNYIDYVLSELLEYNSDYNQAEESNNSKYSGFELFIYTDSTKTQIIDINTGNVKNVFNNYKYPYFDKGKWNFNYFRNHIENNKADYQSLIYGKYIVARFIFNTESNKRIKFENINFNVNKY